MAKGAAAAKKAEQRNHDEWLRCLGLLNAAFGTVVGYESWDEVPTFRRLPVQFCPTCSAPFTGATYPKCGFCGEKVREPRG